MKTHTSYFRAVFQKETGVLTWAENLNAWLFFPNWSASKNFPFKKVNTELVEIIEQTN